MTNKIVVDCSTGEVQEIALTEDELAEREAMAEQYATEKAAEDAQKAADAIAKSALLKKLGISEAEARLLLS
jgi:hypothetical protein